MNEKKPGFVPDWPLPANVRAFVTHRQGGGSRGPYANNNLALHVGDDAAVVEQNRSTLMGFLEQQVAKPLLSQQQPVEVSSQNPLQCQWLRQVHGSEVIEITAVGAAIEADGCITSESNLICAVMTADCVPLLLCDQHGDQVAAVHAGWRGLQAGIIPIAVDKFESDPADISAYIGPAICQQCYEVDDAVGRALLKTLTSETLNQPPTGQLSKALDNKPGHYLLSLSGIAKAQLRQRGVRDIHGGHICTRCDPRFYSYRRDRSPVTTDGVVQDTGRFASLIWKI